MDPHDHDYTLETLAGARMRETQAAAARHRLAQPGARRSREAATMTTGSPRCDPRFHRRPERPQLAANYLPGKQARLDGGA